LQCNIKFITSFHFFTTTQQPPAGQGPLIIHDSWSYSINTHHTR